MTLGKFFPRSLETILLITYDDVAVMRLYYRCSSALYVRLIFDNVVLWRSYFGRHLTYLAPGVDACIRQLLERTELQHGRLLVSHAFAYITVSKQGLTESELEDVLSLDEQVGDWSLLLSHREFDFEELLLDDTWLCFIRSRMSVGCTQIITRYCCMNLTAYFMHKMLNYRREIDVCKLSIITHADDSHTPRPSSNIRSEGQGSESQDHKV